MKKCFRADKNQQFVISIKVSAKDPDGGGGNEWLKAYWRSVQKNCRPCGNCWFNVFTSFGRVKIGSRNRTI